MRELQRKDNKIVLVTSNKFGTEPISQATPRMRRNVFPSTANCIKLYNVGMGRVDHCGQVFSTYRINIRKSDGLNFLVGTQRSNAF